MVQITAIPRLLITPGEPAGVGPDITIKIAQEAWMSELVVIADPTLLSNRAKHLQLPLILREWDDRDPPEYHQPGTLKIIPAPLAEPSKPGILAVNNASYVLHCLEKATDYCLNQKADALITGPVHKGIINEAGIPFRGHTEFLAARCHVPDVVMLFVADEMKVALATTHIALADVPQAITAEKLICIVRLLHQGLQERFAILHPRIVVCGLNPHAGEQGHIGKEEIQVITPALNLLRAENINVRGPFPADTIFTDTYLKNTDAVLAMYHDQALPVVKYLGFGRAVNVTLGLPIIRTSVDHGTALDVAGSLRADAGSLKAAIALAIKLTRMLS